MKNSKTPKIVVAAGLVAVYASGMAYLALSDRPKAVVAQSAPLALPGTQTAMENVPSPAITEAATEPSADVPEQPAATPAAVTPVTREVAVAPTIHQPPPAAREPARASEPMTAPEIDKPAAGTDAAVASNEAVSVSDEALPSGEVASAAAGDDSQITNEVKTQIAAVVPAGTVDVTTRNGVVELAGSVPSQEQIDKVWLAARNVPAVRGVDISALMISN